MTDIKNQGAREALELLTRAPGKRPSFLGENALDHMFTMIMELSSQVWVLKERLYAYESLSNQANSTLKQDIEAWAPSPEEAHELEAMRQAMLQNLFRSVTAKEPAAKIPDETKDPAPPD